MHCIFSCAFTIFSFVKPTATGKSAAGWPLSVSLPKRISPRSQGFKLATATVAIHSFGGTACPSVRRFAMSNLRLFTAAALALILQE